MPKVLPIFPIYPSPTFLKYNVSLGIPGPKLHEIPKIGPFAKKNGYPNSTTAILIPDIKYIEKFVKAELGIAAAMVNVSKAQNLAMIKDPEVKKTFEKSFGDETEKTGMYNDYLGFFAVEKSIMSSTFETQKPYFEIAQFVIKNIVKIEDIIARIMPLVGATVQPALAPVFKSRKPKGNGPAQNLLTSYGTPQALGYQNGKEIQSNLDKLSTQMNRGDGVGIDRNGKYTKIDNPLKSKGATGSPGESSGVEFSNINFTYATISTYYSTGIFDPVVNYQYQYIDLPSDYDPTVVNTPVVDEEEVRNKNLPDRIILGIFDKDGVPINPNAKIKYWGSTEDGLSLEIQDSIFEKAPWIKNEKWLFSKSIDYPNTNTWVTTTNNIYIWKKWGQEYQGTTPPEGEDGWELVRYRDIINFDKEENQILKYKKDDPVIVTKDFDIRDYRGYYDFITDQQLEEQKIPAEDRPEIKRNVEAYLSEKYPNDKIVEEIQNFSKFGEFITTHYTTIDSQDWRKFYNSNPPSETFPSGLRKLFKPMRFNIAGKVVWISPELDYDFKVIKVDPVLQLDYKSVSEVVDSKTGQKKANEIIKKNSDIKEFVKSRLQIKVLDKYSSEVEFYQVKFSMKITKGQEIQEFKNIETYDVNNWQISINNQTGEKTVIDSDFRLQIYFDKTDLPPSLKLLINKEYRDSEEYLVDTNFYNEDSQYPGKNWSQRSFLEEIYNYPSLRSKMFTDGVLNTIGTKIKNFLFSLHSGVSGVTSPYSQKILLDYDLAFRLEQLANYDLGYQEIDYNYYKQFKSEPNLLNESLEILNTLDFDGFATASVSDYSDTLNKAVDKFIEARSVIKTYTRDVRPSNKTTEDEGPYEIFRVGGGTNWNLILKSGIVEKVIFFDEIVNSNTTVGTGAANAVEQRLFPPYFKYHIIEIKTGRLSNTERNNINGVTTIYNYGVNLTINDLQKFQISVFDSNQKYKTLLLDDYGSSNILNRRLQDLGRSNISMSSGRYGSGYRGGLCKNPDGSPVLDENGNPTIEPDNPQNFGYLRRQQLTELDLEVYYIVEGVKKNQNIEIESDSGGVGGAGAGTSQATNPSGGGGGGYYKIADALGIAKIMIELIVDLSAKLFPAINKLINLLKNPASFVTEIIKSKLEDKFLIFNPDVTKIMTDILNFKTRVDNLKDRIRKAEGDSKKLLDEKENLVDELKRYVKKSKLANFIFISKEAEFKFLIDGPALIGFFGILFGLDLNISGAFNGGVPIKPIFSFNPPTGNLDSFLKKFNLSKNPSNDIKNGFEGKEKEITDSLNQKEIDSKVLTYLDISKPDETIINKVVSKNGDKEFYEETSITYSTGRKIEGINYQFIYLNQQTDNLIREADELLSKGSEIDFTQNGKSPLDNYQLAIEKYQQAYNSIDPKDGDKQSLRNLLSDKIKALKNKVNMLSQPLLKLILGIVTLPLKVVFSIIKWLLDFFQKLVNPIKFPELIAEFLSFKWIMTFFTPKGLLELAGIKFNPQKVIEWCIAVNVRNPLFGTVPFATEYLIPDDYMIADLSEFLNVGFNVKLPTYTAKQYRDLCLRPFRLFSTFLCLIERLINAFIMLIWSVMGITAVIPPPLIKLCNKIPENVEPKDLRDLISGLFADSNLSVVKPTETTEDLIKNANAPSGQSYDFIYEVKLPDGTIKSDLDRDAVQKLIDQNKGLDFDFLNFETLE